MSEHQQQKLSIGRVLLIEDDESARAALTRILQRWTRDIVATGSVREAVAALESAPDTVLLDIGLPDGSGLELAGLVAARRPLPRIIAMSGGADPTETFRLAHLGVRVYLPKPFNGAELDEALIEAWSEYPDLELLSAQCVGPMGLLKAREIVRRGMTAQALALAGGNRTKAASLLGVSRQALQRESPASEELLVIPSATSATSRLT